MFLRILLIFFLWLLLRRLWRTYMLAKARARANQRTYQKPQHPKNDSNDLTDITQQEISDADFEDLDEK